MGRAVAILVAAVVVAEVASMRGQGGRPSAGKADVVRLDPSLDGIVSAGARLQLVKTGFGFVEGTTWVQNGPDGYLLFSDIPANVVYKLANGSAEATVFLRNSGYTGPFDGFSMMTAGGGTLNGPFIQLGSDGLAVDPQGRLIVCAFGDRALIRIEKDGRRTVLADGYDGRGFNGPNDVIVKRNGSIYFTDTFSGLRFIDDDARKGKRPGPDTLSTMAVFLLKDGRLTLGDSLDVTNGLALSPDEAHLYVNSRDKIYKYDIRADDTPTNRRLFVDMSGDPSPGSADGMKVDSKGNVYATGPGGIWIVAADGRHLGTIALPAINLTFGDSDWRSVYIASRPDPAVARTSSIYRIRVEIPGTPCWSCT